MSRQQQRQLRSWGSAGRRRLEGAEGAQTALCGQTTGAHRRWEVTERRRAGGRGERWGRAGRARRGERPNLNLPSSASQPFPEATSS